MPKIECVQGSEACKLYNALRQAGVSPTDIDRGYHVINSAKNSPKSVLIGKGDGYISDREIYETALDLYDDNPSNEKYRRIVEGFTGAPIPWSLNDGVAVTVFDNKVRERIQNAVQLISNELKTQNINPGDGKYEERLAVGLFYLTLFPSEIAVQEDDKEKVSRLSDELAQIGLKEFQSFLIEKGGLGASMIDPNMKVELGALDALQQRRGKCTEFSKIFYGVLRQAGLRPFFVSTPIKDDRLWRNSKWQDLSENKSPNHMYVGLALQRSVRYFDVALEDSHVKDATAFEYRLLDAWLSFRINTVSILKSGDNMDAAEALYRENIHLKPGDPLVHAQLALVMSEKKKYDEAISEMRKAAQLDPKNADYFRGIGSFSIKAGKIAEAEAAYREAIHLNPQSALFHFGLSTALEGLKNFHDAIAESREAIRLEPTNQKYRYNLCAILSRVGKFSEAENGFRELIKEDGNNSMYYFALANALKPQGKFIEAEAAFQKAIELNPNEYTYYWNLGDLYITSGKLIDGLRFMSIAGAKFPDIVKYVAALSDQKIGAALPMFRKSVILIPIIDVFERDTNGSNFAVFTYRLATAITLWKLVGKNNISVTDVMTQLLKAKQAASFIQSPTSEVRKYIDDYLKLIPQDMLANSEAKAIINSILPELKRD